ncbi:MAG TPA: hypothetical protein VMW19_09290 [Myxococcota bacterium]|nr:hypothetical protein [Myxococcota bacterium]
MRTRRVLGLAIVLLAFVPGAVAAGDLCACHDGHVVQVMEDGVNLCQQACADMGGGESMQQTNPNAGTKEDEERAVREASQKPITVPIQTPGPNRKP